MISALASAPFDLADYLHLASLKKHSVLLQVLSLKGTHRGWVEIVEGEVWCVSAGLSVGEKALAKLLFEGDHQVSCETLEKPGRPREIHRSVDNLLLELARIEDERKHRGHAGLELVQGGPRKVSEECDDFSQAFQRGFQAALQRNYAQAAEWFRKALEIQPTDLRARANLDQVLPWA